LLIEALFLLWDLLFCRIVSLAKNVWWAVGVLIWILFEMLAGLNRNRIYYLCRWSGCWFQWYYWCSLLAKRRCVSFWFYLERSWKLWTIIIKVNCIALGFLIIFLNVILCDHHHLGRLLTDSWKRILLWKGMIMVTNRAWENLSIGFIFSCFHCIEVMCLLLILRLAVRRFACNDIYLNGSVIVLAILNVVLMRLD